MKEIPLVSKNGIIRGYAIIDDIDFDCINQYNWFLANGRAVRKDLDRGNKNIYMHREIMGALDKEIVDHKNRNPLDNRKENLRFCTSSQNSCNSKIAKSNTSGFKGISFIKKSKKWRVRINIKNKQIFLGTFRFKKDAINAYKKGAIKYHDRFMNFY